MSYEVVRFEDVTTVRFECEEDMEQWPKEQKILSHDYVQRSWSGPGWYVAYVRQERCPRNCCWDLNMYFESAESWLAEQMETMRTIGQIRKMVNRDRAVRDVQDS